jgi:hypothetical protein
MSRPPSALCKQLDLLNLDLSERKPKEISGGGDDGYRARGE